MALSCASCTASQQQGMIKLKEKQYYSVLADGRMWIMQARSLSKYQKIDAHATTLIVIDLGELTKLGIKLSDAVISTK